MKKRRKRYKQPFFRQEKGESCLVACLRMVLAHFGVEKSETELREECGFQDGVGVYIDDILRYVQELSFQAEDREINEATLRNLIEGGIHPIAFMPPHRTGMPFNMHAVVVKSVTKKEVVVHDPFFDEPQGVRSLSIKEFEQKWKVCRGLTLVIQKGLQ